MRSLFYIKKHFLYFRHARKGKYAHSPFVYQLSMAVFEKKSPLSTAKHPILLNSPLSEGLEEVFNGKYGLLTAKIAAYFNVKTVVSFPSDPIQPADMTLINIATQPQVAYDYFEETVKYSDNDSVIIIKELYHSPASALVWGKIKSHPKTTVTLDLFHIGIVFFRRESSKENFIVKY